MKKTEKKTAPQQEAFQPVGAMKLMKPLDLDGKTLHELPYDFDALTAEDIITADNERSAKSNATVYLQQIEPASLICLFALAVQKKLPNCEVTDILRMGALDAQKAMTLGRRFFTSGSEDGEEETSEEPSPI